MSFIKFLMEQQTELSEMDGETTDNVVIPGIGSARREQIERQVQGKLADLAARAQQQPVDWVVIKQLLNHSGLHAYLDALIAAQDSQHQ